MAAVPDREGLVAHLKRWARCAKRDIRALYLASKDPRVPWYAKAAAVCVVAYALSPIDLIPDFVPVLGYLDDAILLPLGILLAVRLIPDDLMEEHRAAVVSTEERGVGRAGAVAVVAIWILVAATLGWWLWA